MKLLCVDSKNARALGWCSANALRRALGRAAKVGDDGVLRAHLGPVLGVKVGSRWRVAVARAVLGPLARGVAK
jgi:hypothetical protein